MDIEKKKKKAYKNQLKKLNENKLLLDGLKAESELNFYKNEFKKRNDCATHIQEIEFLEKKLNSSTTPYTKKIYEDRINNLKSIISKCF